MKLMNKTLFAVLALFGVTSGAFGYDFTFNNKTNKPVAVKLNLVASLADFDDMAVVPAGKQHKFSFGGLKSGFCLKQILFGSVAEGSLNQSYPTFVEAEKYTTIAASRYALNVCQSLAFDITEPYGGGLMLQSASE